LRIPPRLGLPVCASAGAAKRAAATRSRTATITDGNEGRVIELFSLGLG
jgi:hypothetical protein